MARVAIAIVTMKGPVGDAQTVPVPTSGDSTNDHSWAFQDGDTLLMWNEHGSTATGSITLKAVADSLGRSVDSVITSLAAVGSAGHLATFGPLKAEGWQQTDGTAQVDLATSAGALKLIVMRKPAGF